MEQYLIHHGILGQKWGVRRYQNKDGSLTSAGQKRYGAGGNFSKAEKKSAKLGKDLKNRIRRNKQGGGLEDAFEPTVKIGKDKEKISPAEKITKDSKRAIDETKNAMEAAHKLKNINKKTDYSQMTNKEIQERINRLNLEKQLRTLEQEDTSKGYEVAMNILSVLGSTLGVAVGVLGVVSTVNKLKNG